MNFAPWSTSRSLAEVDAAVLQRVQAKFESPGWSGPSTGLIDLDRLVGPLVPGTLIVVEGAAGSGRSTMLITVALANARKEIRTTFVSPQAEYDEIGLRFLAARSAVDLDRLREARLHERDWLQVGQAISHELPIELVSTKLPYLRRTIRAGLRSRPAILLVDDTPQPLLSRALQRLGLTAFDPLRSAIRSATCAIVVAADAGSSAGLASIADVVVSANLSVASGVAGRVTLTVTKNRRGPTGSVIGIVLQPGGPFVNVSDRVEGVDPLIVDPLAAF